MITLYWRITNETIDTEQIVNNWNELIQLIEGEFDGERKEKLLEMYKYFEDRMSIQL